MWDLSLDLHTARPRRRRRFSSMLVDSTSLAFDESLASKIRAALAARGEAADERRMFGGLAFMVRGHMCVGVTGDDLMVRVGPDQHDDALGRPHARPMDFTGRPLKGMVCVGPAGCRTAASVDAWLGRGLELVASLPVKAKKAARRGKA